MKGNRFKRGCSVRRASVALLTITMLAIAPLASAQTNGPNQDPESWGKALGFVSCAVAIVLASTTAQVWLAALTCGKVIVSEIGI